MYCSTYFVFFFKQKTAYEMRISDWSSDVCSSDLGIAPFYTAAVTRSDPHERARLARIGWMTVGLLAALTVPVVWLAPLWLRYCGLEQLGRASSRERVCQYV